jgi:hypothetical protein
MFKEKQDEELWHQAVNPKPRMAAVDSKGAPTATYVSREELGNLSNGEAPGDDIAFRTWNHHDLKAQEARAEEVITSSRTSLPYRSKEYFLPPRIERRDSDDWSESKTIVPRRNLNVIDVASLILNKMVSLCKGL